MLLSSPTGAFMLTLGIPGVKPELKIGVRPEFWKLLAWGIVNPPKLLKMFGCESFAGLVGVTFEFAVIGLLVLESFTANFVKLLMLCGGFPKLWALE